MKITKVKISGMHCSSCAAKIEDEIKKIPAVKEVSVNFATAQASVRGEVSKEKIEQAIEGLGYTLKTEKEEESFVETARLKKEVIFSGILCLPIFLLSMVFMDVLYRGWILFLLTTPVQFYFGSRFHKISLGIFKGRSLTMDSLVSLGTFAAYFFSLGILLKIFQGEIFFETSALLIFFLLLGKYLEARSLNQTNQAIKSLAEVGAKEATVLVFLDSENKVKDYDPKEKYQEKKISVSELQVGDIVVVKPGEKIPVDGKILYGESTIDESMITGEAMPVQKKEEDKVIGGTVNKYGNLVFLAEKVGQETMLNQIINFVENALASKAPTQKLADKISAVFVPLIITISVLVLGYWLFIGNLPFVSALSFAIAVLVISCPCALGLATPTAIMVGAGIGAQKGILIKGGESLQKAAGIKIVVFDKTGTLTKGEPSVVSIKVDSGPMVRKSRPLIKANNDLLRLAAGVEQKSEHPLATAIVKKAREQNLVLEEVKKFKALPGSGVEAEVKGFGKVSILSTKDNRPFVKGWKERGATVVEVLIDDRRVGFIALADTLKENAKETIKRLGKQGFTSVMITGDDQLTAASVAKELEVEEVIANVLPEGKAKEVEKLKAKGKTAFVGDGINDAPALSAADLGIAMGSGTDVARETGDIILVKNDPLDVIRAIKLAKETFNKVKFNFFWAFFYNLLGIPIAAGALSSFGIVLKPEFAGLAMAFSSVSVVANSLLLKRVKLD